MAKPVDITDSVFEESVLQADKPVLVDFWAPWCGPCRMVAPIVEELSAEYEGKMTFAKLNTDENGETPRKYQIMGIPTLIIFKDGQEAARIVGARGKNALKQQIDAVLA